MIQLYSHGVTTREISDLIEKMYRSYYSAGTVANISKQVASQVESYHQRQLSDKFFCVYLDATYIPLRRDTYQREAAYVAVGIKPNGHKEIIDYRIAPVENIEIWGEMISNFKERGLEQVELFLSDGFVGIKDMLKQYYPKSKFQRCLVHVMRNIKGKVRVSDRKEALDDFKQVHKQSSLKEAETVLHAFYDKYDSKYSSMIKNLQKIEEDLLVFYQYPKQIRPSIYSTNMIESINKNKKLTKSAFYFYLIKVLVLLQDLQILLLNFIWNEILADPQAGVAVASLAWHQGDGFDAGNVFHGNIHQVADAHSLPN